MVEMEILIFKSLNGFIKENFLIFNDHRSLLKLKIKFKIALERIFEKLLFTFI